MADIDISVGELPEAEYFDGESILLVENQGIAEKVSGAQIKGFLRSGDGGGGGSGGGVSKASELENDVPFVSAGSAQALTDAQKEQARMNIGASHIRVESTNIGGDTVIQVVVTDANGTVSRFNPKGSDGGVWVPEYNEDTGVIDWEYHKASDFYPVPSPVPTGIPVPTTAAVGQTIVVSEVDADGKPTKWEAANVGAGGWANLRDPEKNEVFTSITSEPDEPEVTLSSISATYTGGNVTVGTLLTELTGVTVTAHYSDGSATPVIGYTLSGTIAEGSNTVTVSYGGKTTTFTVVGEVKDEPVVVENNANLYTLDGFNTTGYYHKDTGEFTPDATVGSCALIPVIAGKEIAFNGMSHCFFDADKKYITGSWNGTSFPIVTVVPDGAKYISFAVYVAYKAGGYLYYQPFVYDEVALGVNLLENMTYTDGFYVDNDGSIKEFSSFCYSEKIPVVPGLKYTTSDGPLSVKLATKYDAYSDGSTSGTIPFGVAYVVVNTYVNKKDSSRFVLTVE